MGRIARQVGHHVVKNSTSCGLPVAPTSSGGSKRYSSGAAGALGRRASSTMAPCPDTSVSDSAVGVGNGSVGGMAVGGAGVASTASVGTAVGAVAGLHATAISKTANSPIQKMGFLTINNGTPSIPVLQSVLSAIYCGAQTSRRNKFYQPYAWAGMKHLESILSWYRQNRVNAHEALRSPGESENGAPNRDAPFSVRSALRTRPDAARVRY
jgi:hypothetical protein